MNLQNDYARSWYSCDEVEGDLELRYFNIDRDKTSIIPFIRAAQKYNPSLGFWVSPWSPPSWMKINGDYPPATECDYFFSVTDRYVRSACRLIA